MAPRRKFVRVEMLPGESKEQYQTRLYEGYNKQSRANAYGVQLNNSSGSSAASASGTPSDQPLNTSSSSSNLLNTTTVSTAPPVQPTDTNTRVFHGMVVGKRVDAPPPTSIDASIDPSLNTPNNTSNPPTNLQATPASPASSMKPEAPSASAGMKVIVDVDSEVVNAQITNPNPNHTPEHTQEHAQEYTQENTKELHTLEDDLEAYLTAGLELAACEQQPETQPPFHTIPSGAASSPTNNSAPPEDLIQDPVQVPISPPKTPLSPSLTEATMDVVSEDTKARIETLGSELSQEQNTQSIPFTALPDSSTDQPDHPSSPESSVESLFTPQKTLIPEHAPQQNEQAVSARAAEQSEHAVSPVLTLDTILTMQKFAHSYNPMQDTRISETAQLEHPGLSETSTLTPVSPPRSLSTPSPAMDQTVVDGPKEVNVRHVYPEHADEQNIPACSSTPSGGEAQYIEQPSSPEPAVQVPVSPRKILVPRSPTKRLRRPLPQAPTLDPPAAQEYGQSNDAHTGTAHTGTMQPLETGLTNGPSYTALTAPTTETSVEVMSNETSTIFPGNANLVNTSSTINFPAPACDDTEMADDPSNASPHASAVPSKSDVSHKPIFNMRKISGPVTVADSPRIPPKNKAVFGETSLATPTSFDFATMQSDSIEIFPPTTSMVPQEVETTEPDVEMSETASPDQSLSSQLFLDPALEEQSMDDGDLGDLEAYLTAGLEFAACEQQPEAQPEASSKLDEEMVDEPSDSQAVVLESSSSPLSSLGPSPVIMPGCPIAPENTDDEMGEPELDLGPSNIPLPVSPILAAVSMDVEPLEIGPLQIPLPVSPVLAAVSVDVEPSMTSTPVLLSTTECSTTCEASESSRGPVEMVTESVSPVVPEEVEAGNPQCFTVCEASKDVQGSGVEAEELASPQAAVEPQPTPSDCITSGDTSAAVLEGASDEIVTSSDLEDPAAETLQDTRWYQDLKMNNLERIIREMRDEMRGEIQSFGLHKMMAEPIGYVKWSGNRIRELQSQKDLYLENDIKRSERLREIDSKFTKHISIFEYNELVKKSKSAEGMRKQVKVSHEIQNKIMKRFDNAKKQLESQKDISKQVPVLERQVSEQETLIAELQSDLKAKNEEIKAMRVASEKEKQALEDTIRQTKDAKDEEIKVLQLDFKKEKHALEETIERNKSDFKRELEYTESKYGSTVAERLMADYPNDDPEAEYTFSLEYFDDPRDDKVRELQREVSCLQRNNRLLRRLNLPSALDRELTKPVVDARETRMKNEKPKNRRPLSEEKRAHFAESKRMQEEDDERLKERWQAIERMENKKRMEALELAEAKARSAHTKCMEELEITDAKARSAHTRRMEAMKREDAQNLPWAFLLFGFLLSYFLLLLWTWVSSPSFQDNFRTIALEVFPELSSFDYHDWLPSDFMSSLGHHRTPEDILAVCRLGWMPSMFDQIGEYISGFNVTVGDVGVPG